MSKRIVEAVAKAMCNELALWEDCKESSRDLLRARARGLLARLRGAGLSVVETKRPARKRAKRG